MGKASEEEMQKALRRLNSILDSVPDYISRNLQEMPSNKGYIWKHVHLYGLQPPEKPYSKTVMFEKLPRQVTRIHEWTPQYYRVYRKEGKEVKTLESTEQRTRKKPKKHEPPSAESFPALSSSKTTTSVGSSASIKAWQGFGSAGVEQSETSCNPLSHDSVMPKT